MTSCKGSPYNARLSYSLVAMVTIIVVLGFFSLWLGERIPIHGGFGWDGQFYGAIAQSLDVRTLDSYYIQRILPSAIVHFSLTVLEQPLDNRHVILGFSFLNFTLLLLSCILYGCIGEELNLGKSGFWLGFIGIFVNFAYFKFAWYDPVLTDVAATAISLAMLLFYLRRQQLPLMFAVILGANTWPTLIYAGVFLLAFPRDPIVERKTSQPRYLAAGLAAFVFAGVIALYYVMHYDRSPVEVRGMSAAIPLSLGLCMLYIYSASVSLLHGITARTVLASLTPRHAAAAATLFLATKIPAFLFADRSKYHVNAAGTTAGILMHSVVWPLGFLVCHPVYFGPVFLLFLFFWNPFSRIIREYGMGLTLVVLMGVLMSINTESRQNIPSYVMAVPFLGLLVEKLALPGRFFWVMGALALASSKVWMRLTLPGYYDARYLRFPFQDVFMSQGPWMSNRMFVVQGALVLVTAVLLYAYLKNKPGASEASREADIPEDGHALDSPRHNP